LLPVKITCAADLNSRNFDAQAISYNYQYRFLPADFALQ
jgi:hypothetical protein